MRTLLRVVGVFELIGYFIGIIVWLANVPFEWPFFMYFIIYIVFGQTIGILCIDVAGLLDERDSLLARIKRLENKVSSSFSKDNSDNKNKDANKESVVKHVSLFEKGDEVILLEDINSLETTVSKGTKGVVEAPGLYMVGVRFGDEYANVESSKLTKASE